MGRIKPWLRNKKYIVTASTELNIREGPGTDYEAVGTVPHGEKILSPDTEGWMPIILEDDTIGWVSAQISSGGPGSGARAGTGASRAQSPPGRFSHLSKRTDRQIWDPRLPPVRPENLTTIDLSEFAEPLAHMRTFDGKPFTSVYGHKLLAGPLKLALRLVCDRGLGQAIEDL